MNPETPAVPMPDGPQPPPTLTDRHTQAAQALRAAVFSIANKLDPADPTRGRLMEALLVFQLTAPSEFLP